MVLWAKTKFPGVRYWESDVRDSSGKLRKKAGKGKKWKPDKCYIIRYQKEGKTVVETVGWESDGVSAQFCSNLRGEIVTNIKTGGGGFQSLKEKRANEQAERNQKKAEIANKEKENIPFHVLGDKYIEWANTHCSKTCGKIEISSTGLKFPGDD